VHLPFGGEVALVRQGGPVLPDGSGNYGVLEDVAASPGLELPHYRGSVLIRIKTPYPSGIEVDVDGVVLEFTQGDRTRRETLYSAGKGSVDWAITNDISKEPSCPTDCAEWNVFVTPSPDKLQAGHYSIGIKDLSPNPSYSGTAKISAPLVVSIVKRPPPSPPSPITPVETYMPGPFSAMANTSPDGYTVSTPSPDILEIKSGNSVVYTYFREGEGTFTVFFNQRASNSAVIEDRGVIFAPDPTSDMVAAIVTLGPMATDQKQVARVQAPEFRDRLQSPDGKIIAVVYRSGLSSSPSFWVAFHKANGPAGSSFGAAELHNCDISAINAPSIAVAPAGDRVSMVCKLDGSLAPVSFPLH
jgi:hypothetical protein